MIHNCRAGHLCNRDQLLKQSAFPLCIFSETLRGCCRQRKRVDQRYRIETGRRHFTPVSGWIKLVT